MFCFRTHQAVINIFSLDVQGNRANSWTRNWISLNRGGNFLHQSLLRFAAQAQGSICVQITDSEKEIIISLVGEKGALLIHCSQISSFINS